MTTPLSDAEISRYARQLILPEIGDDGQDAIKATRLAIIGAGGLGTPALMMTASAGFGQITVIDDDVIEITNLNRQFLYREEDCGAAKSEQAVKIAQAQNPHITLKALTKRFDSTNADTITKTHDIIIDASDNPETRYLANRASLKNGAALIFVSAIRFEGQLAVFAPPQNGASPQACYECLFPQTDTPAIVPNCASVGIAGPVTAAMGAYAALEAIKLVTKAGTHGTSLHGKLMLFDGLAAHSDVITTKRDKNCPACASLYDGS